MKVKAKFKCISVTDFGMQKEVKMSAVYSESGENADFAAATPSGELRLQIDKYTLASDYFQPTKEYYLLIEETP